MGRAEKWIVDKELINYTNNIEDLKARKELNDLTNFVYSKNLCHDLGVISGLRCTGKTTLIKQCINSLIKNGVDVSTIAYMDIPEMTWMDYGMLSNEVTSIVNIGYKYIFIDEITNITEVHKSKIYLYDALDALEKLVITHPEVKIIVSGSNTIAFEILKVEWEFNPLYIGESDYNHAHIIYTDTVKFADANKIMGIEFEQFMFNGVVTSDVDNKTYLDKALVINIIQSVLITNTIDALLCESESCEYTIEHDLRNYYFTSIGWFKKYNRCLLMQTLESLILYTLYDIAYKGGIYNIENTNSNIVKFITALPYENNKINYCICAKLYKDEADEITLVNVIKHNIKYSKIVDRNGAKFIIKKIPRSNKLDIIKIKNSDRCDLFYDINDLKDIASEVGSKNIGDDIQANKIIYMGDTLSVEPLDYINIAEYLLNEAN